jgi:hypothetical protein
MAFGFNRSQEYLFCDEIYRVSEVISCKAGAMGLGRCMVAGFWENGFGLLLR